MLKVYKIHKLEFPLYDAVGSVMRLREPGFYVCYCHLKIPDTTHQVSFGLKDIYLIFCTLLETILNNLVKCLRLTSPKGYFRLLITILRMKLAKPDVFNTSWTIFEQVFWTNWSNFDILGCTSCKRYVSLLITILPLKMIISGIFNPFLDIWYVLRVLRSYDALQSVLGAGILWLQAKLGPPPAEPKFSMRASLVIVLTSPLWYPSR